MFTFYSPNFITDAAEIYIWQDLSNTALDGYTETSLFDRDPLNTIDITIPAATNRVEFEYFPGSEVLADTLILQNLNFLTYQIVINGSLAADVTSVPAENIYLAFDLSTITSLRVVVYSVTSGDSIVKMGQMIVAAEEYALPHNPDFANYDPTLVGLREEKQMASGGVTTQRRDEKFQARIGLRWMPESDKESILAMYRSTGAYYFVPFPTTTAWDGQAHEVVPVGNFELFKPARNDRMVPLYAGDIIIKETPR